MSLVSQKVLPIGGFFGLALLDTLPVPGSIWETWLRDGRPAILTWTARAALARLVEASSPSRVWLPPYMCRETFTVAPRDTLRLYRLDDDLSPDVLFLGKHLQTGDLVLGVDYFGWPPAQEFLEFVADRPDVIWVEDRTQCLWMEGQPWASWILYSPRKLVGVADGGILIGRADLQLAGTIGERADATLVLPELMRFEDAGETDNSNWHAAFKAREARFSAEPLPMSRMTDALLRRIPMGPLVEARQSNFEYLREQLGGYQAWPKSASGFAPFGFPIAVDDAAALGAALAHERLFCSRHWPPTSLAVDPADFPREHMLAQRLLTLPCDHRYDQTTLARLVEAVRRLANPD